MTLSNERTRSGAALGRGAAEYGRSHEEYELGGGPAAPTRAELRNCLDSAFSVGVLTILATDKL
jgi:hypothetical protein